MAHQILPHHHPNYRSQQQQRQAVDLRIQAIERHAYCLCLHVKPTTIFIAVFRLIRALLLASILLNTEFTVNEQVGTHLGLGAVDERHRSTGIAVHILTRLISASVSAVGIYAVISGRAALLMPLYATLLVDFFFSLPAFYSREFDSSLSESLSDYKNYPHGNNSQYTRYSLIFFSSISMIIKIYFLCVVWKCYRYLRLIELVTPIRLSEIYPHIHSVSSQYPIVRILGSTDSTDLSSVNNVAPPPYDSIASSMKPPNYEEAMKSSTGADMVQQPGQQAVVLTIQDSEQQPCAESRNVCLDSGSQPSVAIGGANSSTQAANSNSTSSTVTVARAQGETASNQSSSDSTAQAQQSTSSDQNSAAGQTVIISSSHIVTLPSSVRNNHQNL